MWVKPQPLLLVPLALLLLGNRRLLLGFGLSSAVVAVVSLSLLGANGLQLYLAAIKEASTWDLTRRFSIVSLLGEKFWLMQVLLVAVLLAVSWRCKRIEFCYAAGILSSLLFTPYVGYQDFCLLVAVFAIVPRTRLSLSLSILCYLSLEFALATGPVPVWASLGLLLGYLSWLYGRSKAMRTL